MKMYLYYATEENCYETEKHESENPIEDVKQFLKDDGLSDECGWLWHHHRLCPFRKMLVRFQPHLRREKNCYLLLQINLEIPKKLLTFVPRNNPKEYEEIQAQR